MSRRSPYDFAAERVFSAMIVFTRAISRRTWRTLAGPHAHFGWLDAHRHVRKDADPHPAGPLHRARDGTPRCLDLARGQPLRFHRLQAIRAEIQRRAAFRIAVNAALVRLAVL